MAILSGPEQLDDLLVRPAKVDDVDAVLDLLAEASAWLRQRRISQWPQRFPAESVQQQIADGEALLVERAGQHVATLAVAEDDSELWGDTAERAFYISRLAVARAASGVGLGYRLLDWVEAKAAARRWPYVRLATSQDNPALRRYYERARFQHVADPPQARWPTSLYQRAVTAR